MDEYYDAVIVGAGAAGYAAAEQLDRQNLNTCILEACDRPGGRIRTNQTNGIYFEQGAFFDLAPYFDSKVNQLNPPEPETRNSSNAPKTSIKLFHKGKLHKGQSTEAVLNATIGSLTIDKETLQNALNIPNFLQSQTAQVSPIGSTIAEILQTTFSILHPGEITSYIKERRADALLTPAVPAHSPSNSQYIHQIASKLSASIRLNCNVKKICTEPNAVFIEYEKNQGNHFISADYCIVTTPAPIARDIIAFDNEICRDFVDSIKFAGGSVVSVVFGNRLNTDPGTILFPFQSLNVIFVQHSPDSRSTVVTAYQPESTTRHKQVPKDALVDETLRLLAMAYPCEMQGAKTIFSSVKHWDHIGPVINHDAHSILSEKTLCATDRVTIAGDYTHWNENKMPYGVSAALNSGKNAARLVTKLAKGSPASSFAPKYLCSTEVWEATKAGPQLLERKQDGNIAFYGYILQSMNDQEIADFLINSQEHGLWSYQNGFGVTSLDSTIVIDGLKTHTDSRTLRYYCDRLIEEFYDPLSGAFTTIPTTGRAFRAEYWKGPDCVATGYCASLLNEIDAQRYSKQVDTSCNYLIKKQLVKGNWQNKWFASELLSTLYCVRLLAQKGYGDRVNRALAWVYGLIDHNGSVNHSIVDSAAATLILQLAGDYEGRMGKLKHWIVQNKWNNAWPGEPMLVYWMEVDSSKHYYHTQDNGQVTSALANLALAVEDPNFKKRTI